METFIVFGRPDQPAPPAEEGDDAIEADWIARSTASGVVWAHDFRSDAEVNAFRWTPAYSGGNDPLAAGTNGGWVRRITNDGVTGGGCLELFRAAGTADGANWWRPFSPIVGTGNGIGTDDRGDNGALPAQSYAATDGGSQINNWDSGSRPGWYGNATYHSGTLFDGEAFYVQMRIKVDARRTTSGNTQVGKMFYLTTTKLSLTAQEIVTYSGSFPVAGVGQPNYHRIYIGGSPPLEDLDSLSRPGTQTGSDLANYGASQYCDTADAGKRQYCWTYSGGWDTLLYKITPGTTGVENTRLECWAAQEDASAYTKIWDTIYATSFDTGGNFKNGWNGLLMSIYNNGGTNSEFWHRYDQIIFSRQTIACPLPSVPTWVPAPGTIAAVSLNTLSNVDPDPSRVSTYAGNEGQSGVLDDWTGGAFATDYSALGALIVHGGGHAGYLGNEVYAFDLSTRQWVMCGSNYPLTTFSFDQPEGEIAPGIPASSHTYDQVMYLPAADAGNTKGKFIRLGGVSNHNSGGDFSGRAHQFNFDNNTWSRLSSNKHGVGGVYGSEYWTAYDTTRKCAWAFGQSTNGLWQLQNMATESSPTWVMADSIGGLPLNLDTVMGYCPTKDCLVMYRLTNVRVVKCSSLASGAPSVTTSGTAPNVVAAGMEWCPPLGCFVLWKGGMTVYKLTPPSDDAQSGTWVWTSETLTGSTPTTPVNGVYTKFAWSPTIGCFLYVGSRTGSVYAFRPFGCTPEVR